LEEFAETVAKDATVERVEQVRRKRLSIYSSVLSRILTKQKGVFDRSMINI